MLIEGEVFVRVMALAVVLMGVIATSAGGANLEPAPPSLSGSQIIFDDEFDSGSSIASSVTINPAAKWFLNQFFGWPQTPASAFKVSHGVLTLYGDHHLNNSIETASPFPNAQGYYGKVFSPDVYVEARIAFDREYQVGDRGWPSFWALAVQHMAGKGDDRQSGLVQYAEDDFFEEDIQSLSHPHAYGSTLHFWHMGDRSCPGPKSCNEQQLDVIDFPSGSHLGDWHTYGQLIIASKPQRPGMIQNYLDGVPVGGTIRWKNGDLKFAMLENAKFVVILGTEPDSPMRVDWVRVWRPNTSSNNTLN